MYLCPLIGLLRHKSELAFDLCEVDKGIITQVSEKINLADCMYKREGPFKF